MLSPDENSLPGKTDLLRGRDAPDANVVRKTDGLNGRTWDDSLGESRCSDPALSGSHL